MDSNELENGIRNILGRVFAGDRLKRSIKEFPDRLNFACPYCHDSASNSYKKRGNIYLNDYSFHCFNCGAHESVWKLFTHFGEPVPSCVVDAITDNNVRKRKGGARNAVIDIDEFKLLNSIAIPRDKFARALGLVEIEADNAGAEMYKYLTDRKIPEHRFVNFLYKPLGNELYVLNLANNGKDIVGAQVRSFDPSKPKYRSQNIESLYMLCLLTFPLGGLDEDVLDNINKLSLIYNAMNFDLCAGAIYVFEGGIDAFFLPNSLGQCGVKKDVPWLDNLGNVVYFFDNDEAGKEMAARKLKNGHKAFLWGKFLSDGNFKCSPKDLNEFVQWCEAHDVAWANIDYAPFVGDNELDIIYL